MTREKELKFAARLMENEKLSAEVRREAFLRWLELREEEKGSKT